MITNVSREETRRDETRRRTEEVHSSKDLLQGRAKTRNGEEMIVQIGQCRVGEKENTVTEIEIHLHQPTERKRIFCDDEGVTGERETRSDLDRSCRDTCGREWRKHSSFPAAPSIVHLEEKRREMDGRQASICSRGNEWLSRKWWHVSRYFR